MYNLPVSMLNILQKNQILCSVESLCFTETEMFPNHPVEVVTQIMIKCQMFLNNSEHCYKSKAYGHQVSVVCTSQATYEGI